MSDLLSKKIQKLIDSHVDSMCEKIIEKLVADFSLEEKDLRESIKNAVSGKPEKPGKKPAKKPVKTPAKTPSKKQPAKKKGDDPHRCEYVYKVGRKASNFCGKGASASFEDKYYCSSHLKMTTNKKEGEKNLLLKKKPEELTYLADRKIPKKFTNIKNNPKNVKILNILQKSAGANRTVLQSYGEYFIDPNTRILYDKKERKAFGKIEGENVLPITDQLDIEEAERKGYEIAEPEEMDAYIKICRERSIDSLDSTDTRNSVTTETTDEAVTVEIVEGEDVVEDEEGEEEGECQLEIEESDEEVVLEIEDD